MLRSISIDEFVQEFNIEKINFIKIDVEGAEKLVLEGAKKFLSANRNITVLFEASDLTSCSFGYSVKDFLKDIVVSGLSVYYLDKEGNLKDISMDNAEIGKSIYNFIAYS
ncbi:MAG: FkbM family methyltransferase [Calothrix sp. SM1_7_51]|nr:FkbM family methyltransferase [Calothrix sp. SM1_7_51]